MTLEIRTLEEPDVLDWSRALATGFHQRASVDAADVERLRPSYDLARTRGAFDGDRCVGTFRSVARELTVPGGAVVPASAITNVTVTATHRRRGLAGRMMAGDLADAEERGEAVAILIAAEYPIYGRFGFGPATWAANWEVDVPRAALDRRYAGPGDGGRVDLAGVEEVRKVGPELHDRVRVLTPGAINRLPEWWDWVTGAGRPAGWQEPFAALYRGPEGRVEGLARWTVEDKPWPGKLPRVELTLVELIGATPAAEQALWRFLFTMDWITLVRTGLRAPDDIAPLLLGDPRAARIDTLTDFMWLRLLDTPAALTARRYGGAPAGLVLDVHDPAGPAGGRFLLETGPDGSAACTPTTAAADLSLSVSDLACLYLGDESASRLAALGRVVPRHAEAARAADTLFRTPRRPWCPDFF